MRRAAAAALAALAVAAASLIPGTTADGRAKIHCKPGVGTARVDPIVAHGVAESAHLHEFFGNQALLALPQPENATYTDLVGKATRCVNPGDTAAYWIPALLDGGDPLPAARFTAYYRSFDHKTTGQAQVYPADLRLVTARHNWTCGQSSSLSTPIQTIPDCSQSTGITYLTAHFDFPSCWDGVMNPHDTNGNTTDSNHLAFYRKGTPSTCPAGFGVKLPELRETVSWGNGSPSYFNGRQLRLSSDAEGQPAGASAHADFWNTWRQDALVTMVASCINNVPTRTANCG